MDLLTTCKKLEKDMEKVSSELETINKELSNEATSIERREVLWGQEFNLIMTLSHVHGDLVKAAQTLGKQDGMRFVANRFLKRAAELNKTGYIDVQSSR